jgi:hypothetical protein
MSSMKPQSTLQTRVCLPSSPGLLLPGSGSLPPFIVDSWGCKGSRTRCGTPIQPLVGTQRGRRRDRATVSLDSCRQNEECLRAITDVACLLPIVRRSSGYKRAMYKRKVPLYCGW